MYLILKSIVNISFLCLLLKIKGIMVKEMVLYYGQSCHGFRYFLDADCCIGVIFHVRIEYKGPQKE